MNLLKQYYQVIVTNFWDQRFAVVTLGILSALYFGSVGVAWAVTGEFTRWGAHLLIFMGVDVSDNSYLKLIKFGGTPLTRVDGVMVIGMFAGAFISGLFGQNFKLRFPSGKRIIQALVGGMIAGFGTRLAMGCNLAALFTGIPQFSFHTWLFTIGTVIGTYYGLKITMLPWLKGRPRLEQTTGSFVMRETPAYYRYQPLIGWLFLLIFIVTITLQAANGMPLPLIIATAFGFSFGFLIQKGQVCFTSAFRDLWLIGRANTTKALIWGMAVQTIITVVFLAKGMPATVIWWAGPSALLGGLLFGVGIVIAGGCETGWMYRSVEGQIQFWFVGIGNVLGATLLFLAWDKGLFTTFIEPFPRINLLQNFGVVGALLLTACFLFGLYIWADSRQQKRQGFLAKGETI